MRRVSRRAWVQVAVCSGVGLVVSMAALGGSGYSAVGRVIPGPDDGRLPADEFRWQEYFDAAIEPPVLLARQDAQQRIDSEFRSGEDADTIYRANVSGFAFRNESLLASTSVRRRASIDVIDWVESTVDPAVAARVQAEAFKHAASAPGADRYLVPQFTVLALDASGRASAEWDAPSLPGYIHNGLIAMFFVVCAGSSFLALRAGPRAERKGVGAGGTTPVSGQGR